MTDELHVVEKGYPSFGITFLNNDDRRIGDRIAFGS